MIGFAIIQQSWHILILTIHSASPPHFSSKFMVSIVPNIHGILNTSILLQLASKGPLKCPKRARPGEFFSGQNNI